MPRSFRVCSTSLFALVFAGLLTGCISTSVTPLSSKTYAPTTPEDVTIYLEEDDVQGDFEKIAVIYARGDYATTDEKKMFKKVRKKAAELGANGVIVNQVKEPGTGAKVAQAFLGTGASRKGEMVAIFVKNKPANDTVEPTDEEMEAVESDMGGGQN